MSAVLRDILANQPQADPKRTVAKALTRRPKARPERSWFDALADNVIGYDDGVDTPGERLGRGINETAKALYNDPAGTVGGAVMGAKHDLDDLMFHGGAERRPGDVFNYAAGVGAPQAALRTLPDNALGMFAGRNAKTADTAALETAQDMAARGASRDDIWRDTGWFQGVDGEWRFEIDDSAARLSQMRAGNEPAFMAMDHKNLYEAYPDTADINVGDNPGGTLAASYSPEHDRVNVSRALAPDDARQAALHEFMHAVQQREGFSTGSSPNRAADELTQMNLSSVMDEIVEVKNAAPPRVQELWEQRIMAQVNGDWDAIDAIEDELAKTQPGNRLLDLDWDRSRLKAGTAVSEADGKGRYRRTAGEVEARNVQTRRDFTAEQRRATPPWKTQDVPDEQQIIRKR